MFVNWSLIALVILSLTACDPNSNNSDSITPTTQELAIELIANYAQNGNISPTVKDYKDAGVTGVSSTNL